MFEKRTLAYAAGVVAVLALMVWRITPGDEPRRPAPAETAAAADWSVVAPASHVSFVSVKNGETAESHGFGELSGGVSAEGEATLSIALASVDTGIDIRNERMREMFFEVARFPLAEIAATTDPDAFADLAPGDRRTTEVELTIDLHGATASYPATLSVTRLAEDRVAVSPVRPIVVSAADFDLGAGIEALRDVAGLDSIASEVPVTFDLVLER